MMRHILVVEDNPDDADLSVAALRQQGGVEVTVVEDGVEALEYLTRAVDDASGEPALPDVVLLDLKLPRMDGHELLEAIRKHPRLRHLPVVVLTSSIEEHDLMRSYELGVNSYVRKPIDFADFSRVAEHLGQYWLTLNRVPLGMGRGSA